MDLRFEGKTPLEESQWLLNQLSVQSMKPLHILRRLLLGKVTENSRWLTQEQIQFRNRLRELKRVGAEYVRKQEVRRKNGEQIPSFIAAYLDLNNEEYFDEMIQQLLVFLSAGQETTGLLIENCLYTLAEYPEYQDRILKSLATENANVHTNKELNNLIHETNRLFGPVRFSFVRVVDEPFSINGFEFQKDEKIRLGIGLSMTNIKYFDDPLVFRPSRFEKPLEYPKAFLPFFGGPHNCVGQHMAMMEVRVALAEILKLYKLERTEAKLRMVSRVVIVGPAEHHLVRFISKEAA